MAEFGSITSGQFARTQPFGAKNVTYFNLFTSLKALMLIVYKWNNTSMKTQPFSRLVDDLMANIHLAGPFTAPLFAKVLIRVGVINRPDLADEAIMPPLSAVTSGVLKLSNKEKAAKSIRKDCIARFLSASASAIGQSPAVAENLFCEINRKYMKFDLAFPSQPVYATALVDKVPTLFKYHPKESGVGCFRFPVVPPQLGTNAPDNRVDEQKWWLNTFDPSAMVEAKTNIPLTSSTLRSPAVLETFVDLAADDGIRQTFVQAYVQGDKTLTQEYVNHSSKETNTWNPHPHEDKSGPAQVIANRGYPASDEVWMERLPNHRLEEFCVLTPDQLKEKHSTVGNGLGKLERYTSDMTVSVYL